MKNNQSQCNYETLTDCGNNNQRVVEMLLQFFWFKFSCSFDLEKRTPSDSCWRVQLVCEKVQDQSSLEPSLEYNQDQTPLTNQCLSYRTFMQFQISSRRENRQKDRRVIKIRVLRKVFSKQFCFIRCRRQHLRAVE